MRKSKRLARGKTKVIILASSKRKKDLPKLDDVPRKRRKFLVTSTTIAAKVNLPHPSVVELVKPVVESVTEAQLALPAPEPIVEVAPLAVQEASFDRPEAQSLRLMIQDVLGERFRGRDC